MNLRSKSSGLPSTAGLRAIVAGTAACVMPSVAQADSQCWTDQSSGKFECLDPDSGASFSVTGTIPQGASPETSYDGLRYHNYDLTSLDLVASGRITTSDQFDYPVLIVTGGNVRFDGRTSDIISEGGSNVALRIRAGDELQIWAGSVTNHGAFAYGIAADAGRIEIYGGRTVVGHSSIGIYAQSNYGDAIVTTGSIDARQFDATGAVAFAKDWGDGYGCGTAIINVNGAVIGAAYGVRAIGCADTEVHVLSTGRLSAIGPGVALETEAGAFSRVTVDGSIIARAPEALAVDLNGQGSSLTINTGGLVEGRYDGTDGADYVRILAGGAWQARGDNDFGLGNDIVRNEGLLSISSTTSFAGLERLENRGRLDLANAALTLPLGRLVNVGTLSASGDSMLSARGGLVNGGLIDMANGTAVERLLVTDRLINLAVSRVYLDVGPAGADRLVVNGTVSGQMSVHALLLPDTPKLLSPTLLVTAPLAGTDAFQLGAVTGNVSPLVSYHLSRQGDGYYLSSSLNQRAAAPLVLPQFERAFWRSGVAAMRQQPASDRQAGWSFRGSLSTAGARDPGSGGIARTDVGPSFYPAGTPRAQIGFNKDLDDTGWQVGISAQYFASTVAGAHGDNEASGLNVQGMIEFAPTSPGWHGSLFVGAQSLTATFNDPALSSLQGSPRTSSAGVAGTIGYRHRVGAVDVDWKATISGRRMTVRPFSVDGIGYRAPDRTSVAIEAGAELSLGGSPNTVLDFSLNREMGEPPAIDAILEGKVTRFESPGARRWLHVGTRVAPMADQGFSLGLTADLGSHPEGSIAALYRF